jgi:uncharacterized protein (TIRG00374 family)
MNRSDPRWLRPLLGGLLLLGAVYGLLGLQQNDEDKLLVGACALGAALPPLVVSLLGWRALPLLRATLAAGIMTFFVLGDRLDLTRMGESFRRWPWLLAGTLLVANQPVLGAARWRWLLRGQAIALGFMQTLRLMLVSFFFNICLPGATGGDIFRAYAVGRESGQPAEAVTTVVLDRFSGLAALLLLLVAAVLLNFSFVMETPSLRETMGVVLGVFALGVLLIGLAMSRAAAAWLRRTWLGRWQFPGRTVLGQAVRALHAYHGSRGLLALAVSSSVLSHLATAGGAWCFGRALGLEGLGYSQYLLIVPLGLAVNAIPVTPGGLGQGQAAFSVLFELFLPGVAGAAALGAADMTFIHAALFLVAAAGALVYAGGYHQFRAVAEEAERQVAAEETSL